MTLQCERGRVGEGRVWAPRGGALHQLERAGEGAPEETRSKRRTGCWGGGRRLPGRERGESVQVESATWAKDHR